MSISMIAAVGRQNEIGVNGDLIWKIPKDLAFFKEITMNRTIIMGRNTFFSLPHRLEGRNYVVLSRSFDDFPKYVSLARNIPDLVQKYGGKNEHAIVIGGAQIYTGFLPYIREMYLTEIDQTYQASPRDKMDYFPAFDQTQWDVEQLGNGKNHNITYRHVYYKRKEN